MGKKTGIKAVYETQNGTEISDKINGRDIGLSYNKSKNSYYTMIPKELAGEGAKRSKQVWLKSDLGNAVIKFRAIVKGLKGEAEKTVNVTIQTAMNPWGFGPSIDPETGEYILNKITQPATEEQFINWLKKELQNPHELAKKTGIDAFNHFYDYVQQEQIALKTLFNNYVNSARYKNIKDDDEKKKTKKTWNEFCSLIGKTHLEQITLADVKKYETYLHSKKLADKTIHHYKNRVSKIFRFNLKNFDDTTKLLKVLDYFDKWESLEVNTSNTIAAQVVKYKDFKKLYEAADKKGDLQVKAVLMLCLNTATYLREVARFKITDIDFGEQTLITKRIKTGNCSKIAYLWDRTIADLKAYLRTRNDISDVLFTSRHGSEYKNAEGLRTRIYEIRKKCNLLKVEFQHLRDTFQTIANEVGVSQYHSNLVMGHSTGRTSERYSHRRVHNELKEACLKIENEFFRIEKKGT